jgi:dihydroorotase-like cyclic amidohydrolase
MVEHFINGRIDWLETDHAPHLLGEKNSDACPSGISSLHAYPLFVEKLKRSGLTDGAIRQRTHEAITERFGIDIPFSRRATRYDGNAYEVRCWDLLKRELDGK